MAFDRLIDIVAKHLTKQRGQAMTGDQCHYRTHKGNMCAVGCLIPDTIYRKGLEGRPVTSFFALSPTGELAFEDVVEHLQTFAPDVPRGTLQVVLRAFQLYHDARKDWRTDLSFYTTDYKYVEALEEHPENDAYLEARISSDLQALANWALNK